MKVLKFSTFTISMLETSLTIVNITITQKISNILNIFSHIIRILKSEKNMF